MFGSLTKRLASRYGYPNSGSRSRSKTMSEATTIETPAVETQAPKTESPAKPRPQPKGSKKPAAATAKASKTNPKAPAKGKGSKATVAKASRPRKEGLREPQVRILKALKKASNGLTRGQISEKATVDPAMGHYLGASDPANYASYSEKYGFPSLLHLGYVKAEQHDINNRDTIIHKITAKGVKALEDTTK